MKSRLFTGNDPAAVIRAVNDWLGGERGITVRHTETRNRIDPATGAEVIEFEVQYDQDGAAA